MTEWQWKVIVAIVRTLLRKRHDGSMLAEDETLFEEVLEREK